MSRHLQQFIWSECAYTVAAVSSSRWHLGSSGRFGQPGDAWKDRMTVTKGKQLLFIQRLHFTYQLRRRQTKSAAHARLSAEAWDSLMDTTCLLEWCLASMMKAVDEETKQPLFSPNTIKAATTKILEGCLRCSLASQLGFSIIFRLGFRALGEIGLP